MSSGARAASVPRCRSTDVHVAPLDRPRQRARQTDLRQVLHHAGEQRDQHRQGLIGRHARLDKQRLSRVGQRDHVVRRHHRPRVVERQVLGLQKHRPRPQRPHDPLGERPGRLVPLDPEGDLAQPLLRRRRARRRRRPAGAASRRRARTAAPPPGWCAPGWRPRCEAGSARAAAAPPWPAARRPRGRARHAPR